MARISKTGTKKSAQKSSMAPRDLIDEGEKAPALHLADQNGHKHRLSDYVGKWVILYFYPRDNTPGCTKQACQFRDAWAKLNRSGAVVLGISPDTQASHTRFAEKFALPFDLLVDTGAQVSNRYGVWQKKSLYGRHFMGIVRTTYLINPAGKVAQRFDKVKVPGHEQQVLQAIDDRC